MSLTRPTDQFKQALLASGFTNDVPACMQITFGGTRDSLFVDIKVIRKSDGLPLVEIGRVHGIQPGTTVTLEDIANAFHVELSSR